MELGRSSNPALSKDTFKSNPFSASSTEVMTVQGTVNKVSIMLLLVLMGAIYTWNLYFSGNTQSMAIWAMVGGIGGFIVSLVTIFKKEWSAYSAPIYAVLEGLFLGAISSLFEAHFHGIVIQAVALTFATLFALLFAYKSGIIKVTEKFKLGVFAATAGIALTYLVAFILGLFHVNVGFLNGSSTLSIVISLVVVVVAALNLVLDFDFIEEGQRVGAPKYMEWYGAFGLIVTLVWLYIEFLRLLSKINSRN
jgi:uncharacterized YccA/Bax inhibitor family protein